MKRTAYAIMVGLIMSLIAIPAYCQDKATTPSATQEEQPAAKAPEATQPQAAEASQPQAAPVKEATGAKEMSIYGEVQTVNAAGNSISVQYYDYDSDEEKTVEINVGKDTKLENATGVGDIKSKNWVDVTYKNVDGKNVASSVAVEKEEEEAPAAKAAPEVASEKKDTAAAETPQEPPSEE